MKVLRKFSIFFVLFMFNYLFCFVLSALKTPLLLVLLFYLYKEMGILHLKFVLVMTNRLRFRRSTVNRLYSIDK